MTWKNNNGECNLRHKTSLYGYIIFFGKMGINLETLGGKCVVSLIPVTWKSVEVARDTTFLYNLFQDNGYKKFEKGDWCFMCIFMDSS